MQGTIRTICTSEKKGTPKQPVEQAVFIENFGIEGDAHAGAGLRQVSLLPYEKIEAFQQQGAPVTDGAFGENLIIEGIDFSKLGIGTRLQLSDAVIEITQIGKECHHGCAIFEAMGRCIMPTEGIFAKVLQGGTVTSASPIVSLE